MKVRTNLIGEMAKRRIAINDIAELLDIHRNSVANKIYGRTRFSLDEALQIYDRYFSDCDFRTLFAAAIVD